MDDKNQIAEIGLPKIYTKIPDGWKVIRGATTAPYGHVWIFNGKPLFSDEYKHALLVVHR